jgi:hypothetical protein
MFFSPRYELTLPVLLLYLALVDGALRLYTGVGELTLLRDALLYAIVIGAVARMILRGERPKAPPFTGWVVAFTAVTVVQLANPDVTGLEHSLAALRPHLEWVPLFFLGYLVLRTSQRLRVFFVLLLITSVANGAVSLVQLNLSLDEFAAWGPGYRERVEGTGDVSGRFYKAGENAATGEEDLRTRAFGLGSDIGFGGILGMIALPGGLALVILSRRDHRRRLAYALLTGGAVFAVMTSSARLAVVTAALAVSVFSLLATRAHRAAQVLASLCLAGIVTAGVGLALSGGSSGAFNRYSDIVPTKVLSTAYDYRSGTLALVPRYAVEFPFGAGIGRLGPAAGFVGDSEPNQELNGESEFTYLLVELGIAGLLILFAFNVRLILGSWRRIRRVADEEKRVMAAALLAPVVALFIAWIASATTATSPAAPYFWFAAGALAYLLFPRDEPAPR